MRSRRMDFTSNVNGVDEDDDDDAVGVTRYWKQNPSWPFAAQFGGTEGRP